MYAIISDLHSNIEALDAVLADIDSHAVDAIYCLGDVIGYGPDPIAVLERVKRCAFILMGNHEEGLMFFAEDFNPRARAALEWTKAQIMDPGLPKDLQHEIWQMIDAMPRSERRAEAIFVHGSLRNETREYVMPGDIGDRRKMNEIFALMDRGVCFFGHTHIPGVWTESSRYLSPVELGGEYVVPAEKVVINVGSVGQPRDGDNRACYALVDGDKVTFRRVAYDYEATMRKIMRVPELSDTLAARLKIGR
ncbi:MAG: metallophosphoesterase family protein [Planctomycetes bacterium]|nr:metallophosphoesterase family protein [Planctomycetota bacterium]